jgi:hypothetical protein
MKHLTYPTVLALALITGCQTSTEQQAGTPKGVVACPEVRPEICTQHYDPVCAMMKSGANRTAANACQACADTSVEGYRPGACEAD